MNFDMTFCSGKRCPESHKVRCQRSLNTLHNFLAKNKMDTPPNQISVSDLSPSLYPGKGFECDLFIPKEEENASRSVR